MSIEEEVYNDLIKELSLTESDDIISLQIKVKNAVREVRKRRNYPSSFSEDKISSDLENLYSNIHDLALYDFNQIGAEGQTSHSENGESRTWKNREDCLRGVFAFAGI